MRARPQINFIATISAQCRLAPQIQKFARPGLLPTTHAALSSVASRRRCWSHKKARVQAGLVQQLIRKNNMPSIPQSRIITLPKKTSRAFALLKVLLSAPGTFYQICERAGFDIEGRNAETTLRGDFDSMVAAGTTNLNGIVYSISGRARIAMIAAEPAAPFVGQVAAPAYRGTPYAMPVHIVRRPETVHA